jgi:hypothetical protein
VGVRVKGSGKLVAFISGIPSTLLVSARFFTFLLCLLACLFKRLGTGVTFMFHQWHTLNTAGENKVEFCE